MFFSSKSRAYRKHGTKQNSRRLTLERLENRALMTVNLISNGDFSDGETGFTTEYNKEFYNNDPSSFRVIGSAQTFAIVNSPANARPWDNLGANVVDHTTGTGLLMAVNESGTAGKLVWSQTVDVQTNTTYQFDAFIASWVGGSPSKLDVRFNGISIGTMVAPSSTGIWEEFTSTWNSGSSNFVNIELRNLTTADIGGDFAIDDLFLGELLNPPATTVIGPGNIIAGASDGANNVIAVDLNRPMTLPAGKYVASEFNYQFANFGFVTQGSITPILLTGSDSSFKPIAVGNTVTYTEPTNGFVSKVFGGSNEFILETPTIIYAGLYWDGLAVANSPELRMPIGYIGSGSSFVIYGGGTGEGANPPVIGTPISGTGRGNFQRNYDFSIGVTSIQQPPPASLSGFVYADLNGDGKQNFGEEGIPGVSIILTGTDDLGQGVNVSQLTDEEGAYIFSNLRPGGYKIREIQPAGFAQGRQTVGSWSGTPLGYVSGVDEFFAAFGESDYPTLGTSGINYNFGERPVPTGPVQAGQTAGIGFWNNKNGQTLIKALNGGTGTKLADWLATTLPRMFGAESGTNSLVGKSNSDVATRFQDYFKAKGPKLEAQVLATALSVYSTSTQLDPTGNAARYGFKVSRYGTGIATFNVGASGDAFNVSDNTTMTVMDLLLAADAQAVSGLLYNGDTIKKKKANFVFSALNEAGSVG